MLRRLQISRKQRKNSGAGLVGKDNLNSHTTPCAPRSKKKRRMGTRQLAGLKLKVHSF